MIALGRIFRRNDGDDLKIVFIGPCVAKEHEAEDEDVAGIIDSVLTFTELKKCSRNRI